MKIITLFLATLLTSLPLFADTPDAETSPTIIKSISPYSVNETMDRFESILKKKGFTIFARIDHQKNAESIDLTMNPAQVIIFGNPKGGTVLMKKDIAVALDLPLRVAVYQTLNNKVVIAYHAPAAMTEPYDLKDHKVIKKVTKGLNKLTKTAISAETKIPE